MTFIEYLEEQVDKAEENVQEYETFHDKRLADLRNMNPTDAFLYGVASGKLAMIKDLRDLIIEMMQRYDNS